MRYLRCMVWALLPLSALYVVMSYLPHPQNQIVLDDCIQMIRLSSFKEHTLCGHNSSKLVGRFTPELKAIDWPIQEKARPELGPGGRWSPSDCQTNHNVAILVPYRNREQHLRVFIHNMHKFLQRQDVEYGIYIVEQAGTHPFNRGKLLNIAYVEALKDTKWTCIVLHDVDSIPVNDKNLYICDRKPLHLAVALRKYGYRLQYVNSFGGITMLKTEHMKKVNGFSNIYWGWGSEDDDFLLRCKFHGLEPLHRRPLRIGRYYTMDHIQAHEAKDRGKKVHLWNHRHLSDGLKDLEYSVIIKEQRRLFTYIKVDVKYSNTSKYV